jgi:hypothetical protein
MKILTIEYDGDIENPCDMESQWKAYSFGRRHSSYTDPEEFFPNGKPTLAIRRKLEVGTAFVLSYHEHGACEWSLQGTGVQCRWDTVNVAGLLVWEHPLKELGPKTLEARTKDAAFFLKIYTGWCNGYGYYYRVEEVVKLPCGHTETNIVDSCGGFYSTDTAYMFEQIREAVGDDQDVKVRGQAGDLAQYHEYKKKPAPAPTAEEAH